MFQSNNNRSPFGAVAPVPPPPQESDIPQVPEIKAEVKPETVMSFADLAKVIDTKELPAADPEKEVTQTEEVKAETVEPEVPVVEEVKSEPISEKKEQKVNGYIPSGGVVTKRFGDVQKYEPINAIRRPPQNRGLKQFIAAFEKDGTSSIPAQLQFDAESVRFSSAPGIWEEGGATYGEEGSVLLITDPAGGKRHASAVYHDRKFVNGHHAILKTEVGDKIVVGYRSEDFETLAVYTVKDFKSLGIEMGTNKKTGAQYKKAEKWTATCDLAGAFVPKDDDLVWTSEYWDEPLRDINHPAIVAARARLREMFTHEPAYICDYNKKSFDKREWDAMLADRDFMNTTKVFNTIAEMYHEAEEHLKSQVPLQPKDVLPMLTIILDGNDQYEGKPCVWVCCYVTLYNSTLKSSAGSRMFAGCCRLLPGENFFYPDGVGENISVDLILEAMATFPVDPATGLKEPGGTMLRRMTAV